MAKDRQKKQGESEDAASVCIVDELDALEQRFRALRPKSFQQVIEDVTSVCVDDRTLADLSPRARVELDRILRSLVSEGYTLKRDDLMCTTRIIPPERSK